MTEQIYAIARCAATGTLAATSELYTQHGIAAWTPRVKKVIRLPRGKPKRPIVKPLLPSFVFIHIDDFDKAMDLAARRLISEPMYPMRVNGRLATVREDELQLISEPIQEPDAPRTAPDMAFAVGDAVAITGGPFKGLSGLVRACGQDYISIYSQKIAGTLKIPAFMLQKVAL